MVADWSQAKIGYTRPIAESPKHRTVADWSQAKIGYTGCRMFGSKLHVADWSQAKIGYTCIVVIH